MTTILPPPPPSLSTSLPFPSLPLCLSLCLSLISLIHSQSPFLSVCVLLAIYLSYSCYFTISLSPSHLPPSLPLTLRAHKTNFQVDTAGPTSKVNIPPLFIYFSLASSSSSSSTPSSSSSSPTTTTITSMPIEPPPLPICNSPSLLPSIVPSLPPTFCLEERSRRSVKKKKKAHSVWCSHEF